MDGRVPQADKILKSKSISSWEEEYHYVINLEVLHFYYDLLDLDFLDL